MAGATGSNPLRDAAVRVARATGRCFLLNVVLADDGGLAAVAAGEVGSAHERAVEAWCGLRGGSVTEPADLVVVGVPAPRDVDLIQAHKALLAAVAHAKPGAPIVLLARAPAGAGHPDLLPWFEIRKLENHLAALRREFHPYGLTAYSILRIARDHPVHVVSEVSRDLLRPMGLLPFESAPSALRHALDHHDVSRAVVLPLTAY